jgi:adenosine deaminase CECR1
MKEKKKIDIAQVFRDCADDGVPYLEPRINFLPEFMVSKATGLLDLPHREWLLSFDRAVKKVKNERIGSAKPFIGAKIIYSTVRFVENGEDAGEVNEADGKFHSIRWFMRDCIELKKEFPHLICGESLLSLLHSLTQHLMHTIL